MEGEIEGERLGEREGLRLGERDGLRDGLIEGLRDVEGLWEGDIDGEKLLIPSMRILSPVS
jgi:hypothetical protein